MGIYKYILATVFVICNVSVGMSQENDSARNDTMHYYVDSTVLNLDSIIYIIDSTGMQVWAWDIYSIQFKLPLDFKVMQSDSITFTAADSAESKISLALYPIENAFMSYEQMVESLEDWATESKLDSITEPAQIEEGTMNGYWGMYLEGMKQGWPLIQMLLFDPEYAGLGFYLAISYRYEEEKRAMMILRSIKPY